MVKEHEKDVVMNGPLEQLYKRREGLLSSRSRAQRMYSLSLPLTIVLLILGPVLAWRLYSPTSVFWIVFLSYSAMGLATIPIYRMRLRQVENDLQELDFQIDLQQFEVSKQESRAEKILRLNSFQLRRYYDLNLTQNSWVFGLGVFCIVLGIGVIGTTLFLVLRVTGSIETQIITAALGSIGAILSNFVAVIYLRMNTAVTENLTAFHSRLVETQKLLLGNLLASRIDDEQKRWETLSALSLRLMDEGKDSS